MVRERAAGMSAATGLRATTDPSAALLAFVRLLPLVRSLMLAVLV